MEKSKQIFDVSLDSLLDTPIEVEGNSEIYMGEDIPAKQEKPATKEKEADEFEGMFELNADAEKEESEDEQEEVDEDIQEAPSSEKSSPQKGKESKSSSPLTPYAQLLIDEGVLPNLNIKEFDGTADGLKTAMVDEIINAVEMYKQNLPDRIKNFINNYEDGVPLEKLLDLDKSEVSLESLTDEKIEDSIDIQKQLVTDYMKRSTKFSEAKIRKMVDNMEDSGELEEEAKSSYAELKTFIEKEKEDEKKNVRAQQEQADKMRKQELATLHERIRTTQEIIPGIKVNDKVRQNLVASMTQPVGYDQYGRPVNRIVAARMEDPMEFEMKLHYLFEVTKGFKDFSKLADKGRKDAAKQFEDAIEELDKTPTSGYEKPSNLGKQSNDFLKGLSKTFKI